MSSRRLPSALQARTTSLFWLPNCALKRRNSSSSRLQGMGFESNQLFPVLRLAVEGKGLAQEAAEQAKEAAEKVEQAVCKPAGGHDGSSKEAQGHGSARPTMLTQCTLWRLLMVLSA